MGLHRLFMSRTKRRQTPDSKRNASLVARKACMTDGVDYKRYSQFEILFRIFRSMPLLTLVVCEF